MYKYIYTISFIGIHAACHICCAEKGLLVILWCKIQLVFTINVWSKKEKKKKDKCLYLAFKKYLYTARNSLMLDK